MPSDPEALKKIAGEWASRDAAAKAQAAEEAWLGKRVRLIDPTSNSFGQEGLVVREHNGPYNLLDVHFSDGKATVTPSLLERVGKYGKKALGPLAMFGGMAMGADPAEAAGLGPSTPLESGNIPPEMRNQQYYQAMNNDRLTNPELYYSNLGNQ